MEKRHIKSKNVCIRCGKQRIVVRTYNEVVGNSVIVHTDTACPDPECQKQLDNDLNAEKQKRLASMSSAKSYRGFGSSKK